MCRHCDRLTEDAALKPLVHAFMALVATRISKKSGVAVSADDISLHFETTVPDPRLTLLYNDLNTLHA
jgi:hypothetical protein